MQLLLAPFAGPFQFVIFTASIVLGALIIVPSLRAAISSEGRPTRWVRAITSINARYLFGALFLGWALTFGIGLQLVPHEGANSPYGALGLIALFTGFFVMMGLLWAIIRD
jgi:hypothetical protein